MRGQRRQRRPGFLADRVHLVACCDVRTAVSDAESHSEPQAQPQAQPEARRAGPCLFTVPAISDVLGGSWQRSEQDTSCLYRSDRGAVMVATRVDQAIAPGLRAAKASCLPGIAPISLARGSSVCVEKLDDGQIVVGNLGSGGQLWLLGIVATTPGVPEQELRAMTALVQAAPA